MTQQANLLQQQSTEAEIVELPPDPLLKFWPYAPPSPTILQAEGFSNGRRPGFYTLDIGCYMRIRRW